MWGPMWSKCWASKSERSPLPIQFKAALSEVQSLLSFTSFFPIHSVSTRLFQNPNFPILQCSCGACAIVNTWGRLPPPPPPLLTTKHILSGYCCYCCCCRSGSPYATWVAPCWKICHNVFTSDTGKVFSLCSTTKHHSWCQCVFQSEPSHMNFCLLAPTVFPFGSSFSTLLLSNCVLLWFEWFLDAFCPSFRLCFFPRVAFSICSTNQS